MTNGATSAAAVSASVALFLSIEGRRALSCAAAAERRPRHVFAEDYFKAFIVETISAAASFADVSPLSAGVKALPAASNIGEATPANFERGSKMPWVVTTA